MKAFYQNLQKFDVTGRFSVGQRRMAWRLRSHPKAFTSRHGRNWQLYITKTVREMSEAEYQSSRAELSKLFERNGAALWSLSNEYRKAKENDGTGNTETHAGQVF